MAAQGVSGSSDPVSAGVGVLRVCLDRGLGVLGGAHRTPMMVLQSSVCLRVDLQKSYLPIADVDELRTRVTRLFTMLHSVSKPTGRSRAIIELLKPELLKPKKGCVLTLEHLLDNPQSYSWFHALSHDASLMRPAKFTTLEQANSALDWAIFDWNEGLSNFAMHCLGTLRAPTEPTPEKVFAVKLFRSELPWVKVALSPKVLSEVAGFYKEVIIDQMNVAGSYFFLLADVLQSFREYSLEMRGKAIKATHDTPPFRGEHSDIFDYVGVRAEEFETFFLEHNEKLFEMLHLLQGTIVYISELTEGGLPELEAAAESSSALRDFLREKALAAAPRYDEVKNVLVRQEGLHPKGLSDDWFRLLCMKEMLEGQRDGYLAFVSGAKRAYDEVLAERNRVLAEHKAIVPAPEPLPPAPERVPGSPVALADDPDSPVPAPRAPRLVTLADMHERLRRPSIDGPGKSADRNAISTVVEITHKLAVPLTSHLEVISVLSDVGSLYEQLLAAAARTTTGDATLRSHNLSELQSLAGLQRMTPKEAAAIIATDRVEIRARTLLMQDFHRSSEGVRLMIRAARGESLETLLADVRAYVTRALLCYDSMQRAIGQPKRLDEGVIEGFLLGAVPVVTAGAGGGGGASGFGDDGLRGLITALPEKYGFARDAKDNLRLLLDRLDHERARELPVLAHAKLSTGIQLAYVFLEEIMAFRLGGQDLVDYGHDFIRMLTEAGLAGRLNADEMEFLADSKRARGEARYREFRFGASALRGADGAGAGSAVPRGDEGVVLSKEVEAAFAEFERIYDATTRIAAKLLEA